MASTYVQIDADVTSRLPGKTIDATSTPPEAEVQQWIEDFEGEIEGDLATAGISVPVTAARGVGILRLKIAGRVAAEWIERAAIAGVPDTQDLLSQAEKFRKDYDDFRALIAASPDRMAIRLGIVSGPSGDEGMTSTWTNSPDGESIANGDFDPTFSRKGKVW